MTKCFSSVAFTGKQAQRSGNRRKQRVTVKYPHQASDRFGRTWQEQSIVREESEEERNVDNSRSVVVRERGKPEPRRVTPMPRSVDSGAAKSSPLQQRRVYTLAGPRLVWKSDGCEHSAQSRSRAGSAHQRGRCHVSTQICIAIASQLPQGLDFPPKEGG